ncbi:unnamed protein product [Closterium sp. NIES-54]
MAPHTDICKLATPSHASARLNKRHMVSMGSLPARVGGGAVGASRGNAVNWPGARPSGNCGAEKPGACRGQSPYRGCYRRARGHSADRDDPQIQPTADAAGTARGEQNPSGAQEIPSPSSPEIAAESVARGIALAANAYFDPRAHPDDAEESGAGGSDGAREIAGHPLRYEEDRAAQENCDKITAAEADMTGNISAPDPAGQRGGLMDPSRGPRVLRRVTNNPQPRHVPDTTGKLARAEGLAKRGNLAKSLQSLIATPVCTPSAEVLSALTVRHPEASLAIPDWVHDFASKTVPSITACDFRRLLARCPNGVSAGSSGTTFEHLRDAALENANVLVQLHALTNTALAGKLSAEAADLLTASRLLAFSKPQGGTRPIAVGECLLCLIAKAALFLAALAAREHFTPLQFGVAIAGGIEAAIHTARTYLEEFPRATALQIDLANAFNAVERATVFEGLKGTALDSLVRLVRLSYGRPSALYLDHDFGAEPLQSARGVRQGDPLGPMLFAASIHPCLVATAAAHPEVVLLAYADDITVLGEAANCTAAFTHLTEALLSHGLAHNPAKCEAWCAVALDPATLPPGINISLDGVRVLGSPIGPPSGCAARVRERLFAAAEPLPLLSQMDPQLCLLLLTRCVSRRASFLVRATPLEALPLGEWSAWGEELLHTYLAAAHTTIPRDRAERDKIWQQAALPASLGGLGITNPAVEGGFSYLASVVSAAHLLRSFGDSANQALTGLLPLMEADEESTSLLPRRLAALEAELPPDRTKALQARGRGTVREFFIPVQFGAAVQRGAEFIIHSVRALRQLQPASTILQLDIENVFNSVNRASFCDALRCSSMLELLPFVLTMYGTPSTLLLDASVGGHSLMSSRGVRQGDPLGPLLFAAAIQPSLARTTSSHPEITLLAYADDITLISPPEASARAFNFLVSDLERCGLRCNVGKSCCWNADPRSDTLFPPDLLQVRTGVKILGSPVGTTEFSANFLRRQLEEAAEPLPLLSQLNPQHSLLLISRCISRRASYLLRTTPASSVSIVTWREWSEGLLRTALSAAAIRWPSHELHQSLLWRQATLPISLGGLGNIDPISEAPAAFLASTAAATELLASLPLEPTHPLPAVRATLSPDADVTSALGETLRDMEGRLPEEGKQLLSDWRSNPRPGHLQLALSRAINKARALSLLDGTLIDRPGTDNGRGVRLFCTALAFRLGLPQAVAAKCPCDGDRSDIIDPSLPNHLLRCGTGGDRTRSHNALVYCCIRMAREAGYTTSGETTVFSVPSNVIKADLSVRDQESGGTWIGDVTLTDPVLRRDLTARKKPGWAAAEAARTKERLYEERPDWVGFYSLAAETYGALAPQTAEFLQMLATHVAKAKFKAAKPTKTAAKLYCHYRQLWSVMQQRCQATTLLAKSNRAAEEAYPQSMADPWAPRLGDLAQTLEDELDGAEDWGT